MRRNVAVLSFALVMNFAVVSSPWALAQSPAQNTAARALFLEGRDFWDDGKFADAEKKFREALTKYPKADQSDRTAYYLITTLIKLGRAADARAEIENFNRTYPQSTWRSDVEESRIRLSQHPFVTPNGVHVTVPAFPLQEVVTPMNELKQRAIWGPDTHVTVQATGPERAVSLVVQSPSLQSEVLRLIVEKDPDRGIKVARERLRTDPSDPAVVSNFGSIANSNSAQALPFLVNVVGSSPSPNVQTQAVWWVFRRDGDREGVAKALADMLSNSKNKETDAAVADGFLRLNVMERRTALDKFVEIKSPERLAMLERLYRVSLNAPLRMEMVQAAGRIPDSKALIFLVDVAKNDKEIGVRRSAIQALAGRHEGDSVEVLADLLKTLSPPEAKK
jgi:Outer membrane lipoprotein/HEAT repeats